MPLVLAAASAGLSAPARAESAVRPCYADAHLHPRARQVPANAPALVFARARLQSERSIEDHEVTWRGPDGVPLAFSVEADRGEHLLRPRGVLAPGYHQVSFRDFCSYTLPTSTQTRRFTVGPAVPLPRVIGTARQRSSAAEAPFARCLPANVHTAIDVTMSPELKAFQDLTRFRLTYRDTPLAFDTFEGGAVDGISDYGAIQSSETTLYFAIKDVCAPGQERVQGTLKIEAHVAGAAMDPEPLTIAIDATCPTAKNGSLPTCSPDGGPARVDAAGPPPAGEAPDGGAAVMPRPDGEAPDGRALVMPRPDGEAPDGGAAATPRPDGEAPDSAAAAPPRSDGGAPDDGAPAGRGGGCTVGAPKGGSAGGASLFLVLAGLSLRRRVRARRFAAERTGER